MVALSRNAPKLLRSVRNKPHASEDDHEESASKGKMANMSEADIYADPVSSSDEKEPPSASQSSNTSTQSARAMNAAKGRSMKAQKAQPMRVPPRGAYKQGRAHKDSFVEENKENVREGSSPAGKRKAEEVGKAYFGMGDTPKKQRTKNFHAGPVVSFGKKAFGKEKPNTSRPSPTEGDYSHVEDLDNALSEMLDPHETKLDASDAELSSPAPKDTTLNSPVLTTTTSPDIDPSSSPLSSVCSYDAEELEALERDIARKDEDAICALCRDSVDEDEQRAFWAHPQHQGRTVRDQMLFCKKHKRNRAQKEYTEQGFPEVDWAGLPGRIRGFRGELERLLRNEGEVESGFRKMHKERLGSGKAAALPLRRGGRGKDAEAKEQELTDALDATSASTGYYGPRGKRVMMEVITADLSDVIQEVSSKDPVVGRSGFAMFLQAVLIPELTLLLVMEDKECGKGVASELVEESGELGALLHEEIGDEVTLHSDEEDDDDDDD